MRSLIRWLFRRAEGGEVKPDPACSGDTLFLTIDDQLWIKVGDEPWRAPKP